MNALTPTVAGAVLPQPTVTVSAGRLVVDSRDVAAQFDRAHKSVLAAIDLLVARRPDLGQKFLPKVVEAETGGGGLRETRAFDIDRDGFSLLVMGFTGERALTWKIAYIEAFNSMEAEIRRRQAPALDLDDNQVLRRLLLGKVEEVDRLQAIAVAEREGREQERLARIEAEDEAALANHDFLQTSRALTIVTTRAAATEARVEALQPKAAVYDRIAGARESKTVRDYAADSKVQESKVFDLLDRWGWIYRKGSLELHARKGPWRASSEGRRLGVVEHAMGAAKTRDGRDIETRQLMLTPKGQASLDARLNQGSLNFRPRRG